MRRQWLGVWAAMFLGITFVIAGTGKVFSQSGNLEPLRLPEFLSPALTGAVSAALPWVEIIIGALLIFGLAVKFTTGFSTLMIGGFIASNIILINLGMAAEPCGCFGGVIGGGLSIGTSLILDGVMAIMALTVFVFHPSSFTSIKPWCLVGERILALEEGGLSNE